MPLAARVPGLVAIVAAVLILALTTHVASAQEVRAGAAASVSTFGYSLEGGLEVAPRVVVRGGVNLLNASPDFDAEGINYVGQLRLRSVTAFLDWFPFDGRFHVSPGLMLYNGNELEAAASVPGGGRFDLGSSRNLTSDPTAPVTGDLRVSSDRVAPAIVVGWWSVVPRGDRRWAIPVNLGVAFTRAPSLALDLSGRACDANGGNCRSFADDPELRAELANQVEEYNDDLKVLRFLPVLSVGFAYRF